MTDAFQRAASLIFGGNELLFEIVSTTLYMALSSSVISLLIGAPIGVLIGAGEFRAKRVVTTITRTLTGIPPVVAGIVIYVLFSGTGPFGSLGLIYSVPLMVIAQVVLIVPIVVNVCETYVSGIAAPFVETARGLGFGWFRRTLVCLNESRRSIVSAYLFAFARATAEVGAVQIVGGNILHKTRVMTTAIALNYNTGDFSYAVALGIILLAISLAVNCVASLLQGRAR